MTRLFACATLAVMLLAAPQAGAAPILIHSIGGGGGALNPLGTGSSFNLNGVSPSNPVIVTSTQDAPTVFGGSPILFGGPGVAGSQLTINLAGWSTNPGTVTINQSAFTLAVVNKGDGTGLANGDTATFNLGSPAAFAFSAGTGSILVPVTFAGQTGFSGYNFSSFNNGQSYLSISFQVTNASPGNPGTITIGQGSTSSFTLTDQLPAVPEPTTLALWSAIGLAGAWYARRRMLKAKAPAEA
jgi:hypothetical protein